MVLLTMATIVLELVAAREDRLAGRGSERHIAMTVLSAIKGGIVHPVPLPIIVELLFAQTGWVMPAVVHLPLQLLGNSISKSSVSLLLRLVVRLHCLRLRA